MEKTPPPSPHPEDEDDPGVQVMLPFKFAVVFVNLDVRMVVLTVFVMRTEIMVLNLLVCLLHIALWGLAYMPLVSFLHWL